jgi:hypothetical protein
MSAPAFNSMASGPSTVRDGAAFAPVAELVTPVITTSLYFVVFGADRVAMTK